MYIAAKAVTCLSITILLLQLYAIKLNPPAHLVVSKDKSNLMHHTSVMSRMTTGEEPWYATWFDSPYYPMLYKQRDEHEARAFIDHLLEAWQPPAGARLLDLACGRGRYSKYLADKGFDVTGLDLSPASIQYAQQYERDRLTFHTHDMRKPFRINYFDGIFSFFTSFGYFERRTDDLRTLKSVAAGLVRGGIFFLDFFNPTVVLRELLPHEEKQVGELTFHIERYPQQGMLVKDIRFDDRGRHYHFAERVALLYDDDFRHLFEQAGMDLIDTFGDYQLRPFEADNSPRLIMMAQKR